MEYRDLKAGDILQKDDEYSVHYQGWKSIPDFMISNIIPDCPNTLWRRSVSNNPSAPVSEKISLLKVIRNLFRKR